eukprot:CAMPEP_0119018958 /NCGR_PEP_ID=MMETSP1176-20130426/20676_1 /TAXON_ID=265551 /ORGANISM="Synedropsis recta cf, Strain CCMP1620" /LENGTH=233 /DNA_ID=CAMNT_0006973075 /DNA_START=59 /DNA_END=760 /DNA_ORIENTATION=-
MAPVLTRCPSPEMETRTIKKQMQRIRPRKTVTFFAIVTIKAHDHFRDMTPEEIDSAWYKRDHYIQMKQNCVPALRLIMKDTYTGDTDELCSRGLEYRSPAGATSRKKNKANAVRAVLQAQRMQPSLGNVDIIRKAYLTVSEACRMASLKRGQDDWSEARRLYEESDLLMINDVSVCEDNDLIDLMSDSSLSDDTMKEVEEDPELMVEVNLTQAEPTKRHSLKGFFHNRKRPVL